MSRAGILFVAVQALSFVAVQALFSLPPRDLPG